MAPVPLTQIFELFAKYVETMRKIKHKNIFEKKIDKIKPDGE